jgi:transcriptional regulator with XRE-family HTH domain
MSVADKIKALMKLKGKSNAEIAQYFGVSSQAFSTKLYRGYFSGEDLIKIAAFLECELAFIADNSTKIPLNLGDLKSDDK